MNNIEFRAWNSQINKIIYLDPYQWSLTAIKSSPDWIVMMWTGLLDKHHKKIFEGDIITYGGKRNFVVIFHKGYFCYKSGENEYHILDETQVEVIGNIYENPELLKEEL